ncbi:tRNA threonylcarbamoyladenosine biosynthesis protein TsaB [Corynebacterium occultum]|uniref:tRNA threonylcarbamoyladenosine biosynthesis protein TsaB n=1 Tax=Corynebacterium occultum TaxID=2675219 RepID=A0A6B8VTS6_9CORY|nr:tRNA (adenosine(37)-N6)-threonylcarbamoyltransferase complex dimerization subunit type 1 TsaB [Corynebacterium occultum]QGU06489.1 tRNA threonylcarbamoyladenosine biosynthesis protein TsaB [Corynebacterium occultum]
MLVLAIDTSTPDLVVGVVDPAAGTLHEQIIPDTRRHNELLTPTVQQVLAGAGKTFADLDAVVVGCGPGPFTGLRVGMASAAAFGDALGIPVHGVCSLDAIAQRVPADTVLVATDARRREVYWATYHNLTRTEGPNVQAPGTLTPSHPVAVVVVPEHLAEQLSELQHVEKRHLGPNAASLVEVADLSAQPQPLEPLYLRRPDAKEPAPKPKSPAIPDVEL